jgi:uncharacterized protein YqgV (UPF0045/DUF77 family)
VPSAGETGDLSTARSDRTAVRAQVSVYALRRPELAPAVETVRGAMEEQGLNVEVGAMSTQASGDVESVFEALRTGFERVAAAGDVVMTVTISNCCRGS